MSCKNENNENNNQNSSNNNTISRYINNYDKIKIYKSSNKTIIKVGSNIVEFIIITFNNDADNAELEHFNYYESCNILKNLKRKTGTNLMMKSIIEFIKNKFPNIKQLNLFDSASIKCKKENYKNSFSLYDYYLFKYNSTYYNKNYGFEFVDANDYDSHLENIYLIKDYKIDKEKLTTYLLQKAKKTNVLTYHNDVSSLVSDISDNELFSDFIKKYNFDNTCYLMKFVFEFIRYNINNYKTLNGSYYVLNI
jgi:hypothetical protein